MDLKNYLNSFHKAAGKLDKDLLLKKQVEVAVGEVLNSVYLKLYKRTWCNTLQNPLTAETRIFFSVWLNESLLKDEKLFYNIHAFKLRKLAGYKIESRKFADEFRKLFKKFEPGWKNVSVKFGPLTLMEGWLELNVADPEQQVVTLANNFLQIEHIIDATLAKFKK